jgi:hypothetical protein
VCVNEREFVKGISLYYDAVIQRLQRLKRWKVFIHEYNIYNSSPSTLRLLHHKYKIQSKGTNHTLFNI